MFATSEAEVTSRQERWSRSSLLQNNTKQRLCALAVVAAASVVAALALGTVVLVSSLGSGGVPGEYVDESSAEARCGTLPNCLEGWEGCWIKGTTCTCYCAEVQWYSAAGPWAKTRDTAETNGTGRLLESSRRGVDTVVLDTTGSFLRFGFRNKEDAEFPSQLTDFSSRFEVGDCKASIFTGSPSSSDGYDCAGGRVGATRLEGEWATTVKFEGLGLGKASTASFFDWEKKIGFRRKAGYTLTILNSEPQAVVQTVVQGAFRPDCNFGVGPITVPCNFGGDSICETEGDATVCKQERAGFGLVSTPAFTFGYVWNNRD